ncbi:MAG: hypothetical protein HC849_28690 [Oscillatoriales cyanobacterium RU_3_3]|nr:hypothetical protein [Oscillatoriales cyanobacterium RU_3_3]
MTDNSNGDRTATDEFILVLLGKFLRAIALILLDFFASLTYHIIMGICAAI